MKRIHCVAHRSGTIPTESRIFLFLFAVESIEEIPGLSNAIVKIRETGSFDLSVVDFSKSAKSQGGLKSCPVERLVGYMAYLLRKIPSL